MEAKRKPRLYIGILVFVATVALLIFAGAPVQRRFGVWGLAITELIILACAVLPALLLRYDLKAMFAMKKPAVRQVFGVLLLWVGTLLFTYFLTYLIMYLFPQGMGEVAWALNDFFTGAPLPLTLLAAAVMPAVCEEALFRGFIQHSFGGLRRRWLVVLLTGLLFGIFHLDFYRFLPTMLLGLALGYIMAETKNLLLPMLFHFVNNAWSTSLSYLTRGSLEESSAILSGGIPLATVGAMLLFCAVAPWLILAGIRLLKSSEQPPEQRPRHRRVWIATGASVLCLVVGVGITAVSASQLLTAGEKVLDMSFTASVSEDAEPVSYPVTLEKNGYYNLEFSVGKAGEREGYTRILLTDENGGIAFDVSGGGLFGNTPAQLAAGSYTLTFEYHYDFKETETADIRFAITRLF